LYLVIFIHVIAYIVGTFGREAGVYQQFLYFIARGIVAVLYPFIVSKNSNLRFIEVGIGYRVDALVGVRNKV
jgi:hypothetical protein